MARTVNKEEHSAKRNDILDAAQRLVYSKGYERMTIQEILGAVSISSGAFYHYFDSKPAVLEALIERMQQEAEEPLLPIINDPHLPAIDKLQRFLDTLNRSRITHKAFIRDLLHVWFADENAIVREKVHEAMEKRRAPLLTLIVRQGIEEGVFTTLYPEQAGEIILSLARGMGSTLAKLMLSFAQGGNNAGNIEDVVATYAAYTDAVERVLGAPAASLHREAAEAVQVWLATLQEDQEK